MSKLQTLLFSTLLVFVLAVPSADAAEKEVIPEVTVKLGYTMGTHEAKAQKLNQELTGSLKDPTTIKGRVGLAIAGLDFKNSKLNCHFQESIGIDYSKSEFPGSHVCNSDNQLPNEGPNRVAYPTIQFIIDKIELSPSNKDGVAGYLVNGSWLIHGVQKKAVPILVSANDFKSGKLNLTFPIRLSDFGIQVKSFLFISTADVAEVELQFQLEVKSN